MGFDHDDVRYRADNSSKKSFLSLNGAPRAHRIVTIAACRARKLLPDCCWSMLGDKSRKYAARSDEAKSVRDSLALKWVSDDDIEFVMSEMPKLIDADVQAKVIGESNELALKINPSLYDVAACSVATETEFTSGEVKRISEKSMKPIVMGHPMIVVGNPGSLELIRAMGFRTLRNVLDESYDSILNAGQRFDRVFESIVSFDQLRRTRGYDTEENHIEAVCNYNVRFARHNAARLYEQSIERQLSMVILRLYRELASAQNRAR
jgi:hypothetical protein